MPESSERSPVDQAMDLLVYAPIGLLFEGSSLLPHLIEKGRSQVTMARMIGKFAVSQGRSEAAKAATKLQDQAAGVLGLVGESLAPAPPAPMAARRADVAAQDAAPTAPAPTRAASEPAGEVEDLAIPDYDGLSASQVVARLAGLTSGELEAVRRYEGAKRGRKTILSKVAQLQGG